MQLLRALFFAAVVTGLVAGCVTEPGPEDTTVFGHIDQPKHVKAKRVKALPTLNELPAGPVNATQEPAN